MLISVASGVGGDENKLFQTLRQRVWACVGVDSVMSMSPAHNRTRRVGDELLSVLQSAETVALSRQHAPS